MKHYTRKDISDLFFGIFITCMGLLMISWALLATLSMWRFFLYGT